MDQKHSKVFKAEGSPTHFLVYIYFMKLCIDTFGGKQFLKL